jgi:hypothetical protein
MCDLTEITVRELLDLLKRDGIQSIAKDAADNMLPLILGWRLQKQIGEFVDASDADPAEVTRALCCLLVGFIANQEGTDIRQGARIAKQLLNHAAKQRYIVNKNGVVIDLETGQQVDPVSFN